ncbi:MAG: inorganic triphosphatase [Succinivibrio sp.]
MKNKEIELKFGFEGDDKNLIETFKKIGIVSSETTLNLDNTYFDTKEQDLFHIRAGLRIRHADSFSEQTLKVKGENIGGLHQRNEYNVPVDGMTVVPNLKLFPKEALPSEIDIDSVQKRLVPVCRINFKRHLFNLEVLDGVFEVACDKGYIESENEGRLPISELEIELKSTSVKDSDVLGLFSNLCTLLAVNELPLVLEPFSKMHRASLMQHLSPMSLNLEGLREEGDLMSYTRSLVVLFEDLYGYFLVSADPTVLSMFISATENLIHALKLIRRKNRPAFLGRLKQTVSYRDDLTVILKILKSFLGTLEHYRKNVLNYKLRDSRKTAEVFKAIRDDEKNFKIFLIPLKLRLLLSLISG